IIIEHSINERHLELIGAPIFNERGLLEGAVLMFYDITELKNLEVMRKDFVANVSHELKTPITAIRGFSETLLGSEMQTTEQMDHFLKIIYEESDRMQFLIEDLLTLSTLEKEGFQLNLSTVKIKEIVKS